LKPGRPDASIAFRRAKPQGNAMSGTVRKIVYVMFVIVVLLIIWQFLGSLDRRPRRPSDRVPRLRFFRLWLCR
jgi:hypothetical protein